jgi:diguanylate cyclase (GGDEF)-like protein
VPIKDADGKIMEYISSSTDVTELFKNRNKLKNLFRTDSLTGLGNRVSLIDSISRKNNGVLALINIDRFKEINDTVGHEAGDEIIKQLGSRIFNFIHDQNTSLYRVQADVFALYTLNKNEDDGNESNVEELESTLDMDNNTNNEDELGVDDENNTIDIVINAEFRRSDDIEGVRNELKSIDQNIKISIFENKGLV